MLKEMLYQIKENNYKPLDDNASELLPVLLENIGHTDSSLRDDLIYTILATWIVEDVLTLEEKILVMETCLTNLQSELGESGTDSVFLRTFSVLQLSVIYYAHHKKPFLNEEQILKGYREVLYYLGHELDLRGYLSGKGWAHAVAHTADALKFMARFDELSTDLLEGILVAIKEKVMIDDYVYINDEDERLVSAVMEIVKRVDEDTLILWVDSFKDIKKQNVLPNDHIVVLNTKNFLRSLYFRLKPSELKTALSQILEETNRYL